MTRADQFIQLYNQLENWLRKRAKEDNYVTFNSLLERVSRNNNVIARYESFLKSMGALRNVIVHDKDYPELIIAEPRQDVLDKFKDICDEIYDPPKLIKYSTRNFEIYHLSTSLAKILPVMSGNDYSQVIVANQDRMYGLITREGIAQWIEANIQNDIISIRDTFIKDIIKYEKEESWIYLNRRTNVYEGIDAFSHAKRRIQALIISQNGKPNEKPLGLVTLWDLKDVIQYE